MSFTDDGKLSFEEFKAYFADGILTTDELRELFYSIDGRQTKYSQYFNHHRPSHTITDHHRPSHTITDHHRPSHTITDHHIPSQTITDHHRPSQTQANSPKPVLYSRHTQSSLKVMLLFSVQTHHIIYPQKHAFQLQHLIVNIIKLLYYYIL